jgi:nucleoside-diphosphate-sugar epimerase
MKVLLTGASGVIGSAVLDLLVARKDKVNVLALPGTSSGLCRSGVTVFEGDLEDHEVCADAVRGTTVVYHIAGLRPNNPPNDIRRVNVKGTEGLLETSVKEGDRRFVFLSSVAVYKPAPWYTLWPVSEDYPLRTDDDDMLPDFHYGMSKIDAEGLVRRYSSVHSREFAIIRASTVYGPVPEYIGPLLQRLVEAVLFKPRARLFRDQWVHVRDLAGTVVEAGTRPQARNETFNVAGSEVFSFGEVVGVLAELAGRRKSVRSGAGATWPLPDVLKYDVSKARRLLGYTPQMTLREGLTEALRVVNVRTLFS